MKLKHIYLMTRKKNGKRGVNRDKEECRKCIKTLKKEIKKNPLRFQDFSIERHGEKSTLWIVNTFLYNFYKDIFYIQLVLNN